MELDGGEGGGFTECLSGEDGWLRGSELTDSDLQVAGVGGFEGEADVDEIGVRGGLPLGRLKLAGAGLQADGFDAGGAGGGEADVIVAPGDEGIGRGQLPI